MLNNKQIKSFLKKELKKLDDFLVADDLFEYETIFIAEKRGKREAYIEMLDFIKTKI